MSSVVVGEDAGWAAAAAGSPAAPAPDSNRWSFGSDAIC